MNRTTATLPASAPVAPNNSFERTIHDPAPLASDEQPTVDISAQALQSDTPISEGLFRSILQQGRPGLVITKLPDSPCVSFHRFKMRVTGPIDEIFELLQMLDDHSLVQTDSRLRGLQILTNVLRGRTELSQFAHIQQGR